MSINQLTSILRTLSLPTCVALLIGCDASGGYQQGADFSQDPDPAVVDLPIAYISRPIPRDEDGNILPDNLLDPAAFKPGAQLVLKDRASVAAVEMVLTDGIFTDGEAEDGAPGPLYDLKDLSVSRDGLRLLFAMRAPEDEDADEDEQPTWNIWEYDSETGAIRRIITSDLLAEAGEDVSPKYLANGDIVFSSTRQPRAKAILLDENKPQFDPGTEDDREEASFALHTMEPDGTEISQITFNQSHDLYPEVLESGEIVFLRWNNYRGGEDAVSLYRAKTDGSEVGPYYGYHSQDTGTNGAEGVFAKPIQAPDGRVLINLRLRESSSQGGDIVLVDGESYVEQDQLIDGASPIGDAQESASFGTVNTDDTASPRGYYSSAYPMFDGTDRIIASWSDCLVLGVSLNAFVHNDGYLVRGNGVLVDADGESLTAGADPVIPEADEVGFLPCTRDITILDELATPPPLYGIWTFDPAIDTQSPVVLSEEDRMFTEAVVMEARPAINFETPTQADEATQALINDNVGVVHIRSVYDLNGVDNSPGGVGIDAIADPLQTAVDDRPARFIRVIKAVSLPNEDVYDFDNSAFGRAGGQMKDIIGYVPIEPDGSAKFIVPADVAFTFSILDADGQRVDDALGDRHQNWLTVRPGETRECGGCHEAGNEQPHGRLEAEAPSSWAGAAGGAPFPNTVLLDDSNPPLAQLPPDSGETMAEYYSRINGVREPTVNIEFEDEWSDESIVAKALAFEFNYSDMESTAHPTSAACQSNWNALCRIVINYIDHIQPIWEADRQIFDATDPTVLIEDRTCTTCHSSTDAMGQIQIPEAQLELVATQSDTETDYYTSYAELFFQDIPLELFDGVLRDEQVEVNVFDEDGNQVFDEDGNPVTEFVTVDTRIGPYLDADGARDSNDFFSVFASGATHEEYLNDAELKLISEWVDIGGQYYNNPFDAPLAD